MAANDIYLCVEAETHLDLYYGMGSRTGVKGWVYKEGEFNSLHLVDLGAWNEDVWNRVVGDS